MRELVGIDLFSFPVICITTNGFVKNNGECVMGRGCAKTARDMYPGIAKALGRTIQKYGNRCFVMMQEPKVIITYVVKHNWMEDADTELIIKSAHEVVAIANKYGYKEIHIPRPGCGNGKLKWKDVKPLIENILDDRFVIVHK